jgi:hypothetical protein
VKKIISIGLIMLMSVQSFYKLGVVTYFQINREFIAEVLCINKEKPATTCHGQCFLKKKLNFTDQATERSAPAPVGKEKVEFPTFIIYEFFYGFQQLSQAGLKNSNYLDSASAAHLAAPFRPPTVA